MNNPEHFNHPSPKELTHGHVPEGTLWIKFESDRSEWRKGKNKWHIVKKPLVSRTLIATKNRVEPSGVFVCVCCQRLDRGTQDKEQTVSWLEYHLCFWKSYSFSSSLIFPLGPLRSLLISLSWFLHNLWKRDILMWESLSLAEFIFLQNVNPYITPCWRMKNKWEQTKSSNFFLMCLFYLRQMFILGDIT